MAKKDVNVITSLVGKGLEREYILLKELLAAHDVYTVGIHYCNWANSTLVRADVNIFLEVVHPLAFSLSRENWLFPNSEWWDSRNDQFLPRFTRVCCKTHDCYRIWCQKVGASKCVYTGFESRDLYDPGVVRENKFLHVAGESEFKNTEAVIGAWKMGNWAWKPLPLTVVTRQKKYQDLCEGIEDVTCINRATEDELKQLMNSHRFHLIPSAYEGFGHVLNEGIGCGALVITTDAPPMNEFAGIQSDWNIPVASKTTRALAQLSHVAPMAVQVSCGKAIQATHNVDELDRRSSAARNSFLASRDSFRKSILSLVGV
jgi:Glycosyl transferases group 1